MTRAGIPTALVTDQELAALLLKPHEFHGESNYTLNAQSVPA